jgi:hypothetical protein
MSGLLPNKPLQPSSGAGTLWAGCENHRRRSRLSGITLGRHNVHRMPAKKARLRSARFDCPCCGYRTLAGRAGFEICILCWWEDDGQSDMDADQVRGGPNGDLSLTAARANFRDHLTIYRRERDTRIGGKDSVLEVQAKRTIMSALDGLRAGSPGKAASDLWSEIAQAELILSAERDRKVNEYEEGSSGGTA